MTSFKWTDRHGRQHDLDSPALIEAEAAALAQELDRCVDRLDNTDRMIRNAARAAIGELQPGLERLRDDLARWNDHAVATTRAEAVKVVQQIDELPTALTDVLLTVELRAEHDRILAATAGAPEMRARVLAEPMTSLQGRAIAACASRTAPVDLTRGEAKAWLDTQPHFARGDQVDGGWFAWIDRKGHAYRLPDPLAIEREVVAIAKELAALRPTLTGTTTPDALYRAVNLSVASLERLQILKRDLERFDREATAREDAAWTNYAADWRSKRNMS